MHGVYTYRSNGAGKIASLRAFWEFDALELVELGATLSGRERHGPRRASSPTDDPPALLGSRCAYCGTRPSRASTPAPTARPRTPSRSSCRARARCGPGPPSPRRPPATQGEVPFGDRRRRAARGHPGHRPPDRERPRRPRASARRWSSGSCRSTPTPTGNDVVTYAFAPTDAADERLASVVVTGVGMHPFGRFDGVSTTDMGVVAVRAALREAGIGKGGFQAAFCGTAYGGVATGHKVLSRLGMTGMPIVDVEAGCASGGAALMLAAGAIRAGQYDTVLVFGTEKMPKGIIRSSFFEPWQEEAGLAATPAFFALRAQRLCLTSGVTKDHLARVVVKNRRNGAANPDAMYQKETSVEEVLASRVVCEPLHLFMLCSPNEGAAALVLRRADLAAAAPGARHPGRPPCCVPTSRAPC